jgi:hypothetical protein
VRLARAAGATVVCGGFNDDVSINGDLVDYTELAMATGIENALIVRLTAVSATYDNRLPEGTIACRKYVEEHIMPLLPD